MDPRDHPRPLPDGATCTACGAPVPSAGIQIVARRDDVAFVQLACPACGSATLGLLTGAAGPDGAPILDLADDRPAPASGTIRAITADDVIAIRDDLDAWDGDLVGWLDALERGDRRGSVVDG
jgi:hypothetical protein